MHGLKGQAWIDSVNLTEAFDFVKIGTVVTLQEGLCDTLRSKREEDQVDDFKKIVILYKRKNKVIVEFKFYNIPYLL